MASEAERSSSARSDSICDSGKCEYTEGESSESDGETEPAKSFHRRISTNREIKCSVSIKEGYLMKQTHSFNRWRRRYFKLKRRKLYYAKSPKSSVFDEIELSDLSVAECSTKNVNHSFQCITPFRSLVLGAESRPDMEEWISALKSAAANTYFEGMDQVHSLLSGQHNWYATSHARPTYCNVCREALSGVTSHGLSCEVCKLKAHKRCANKALNNCKWTTLSSVGKDIIEDDERNLAMAHQWLEGNLPVSAKCSVCDKTCGSVLRLQDWRCLWCRATVHTACRPLHPNVCPLGPCRVSIVPPIALTTIGTDDVWEATRPQGCSPLLVFVNSKSGDNQGVRFLRRFKQLLNPAQVFDLVHGGPVLGLRLFNCFNPFRILICSGDGSVGWVLSEIDKLHMTNQCQVGVLPLGTGNDLARVLGWGSSCDDDAHVPHLIERYERATTKMLDRWSIMSFVSPVTLTTSSKISSIPAHSLLDEVVQYEDSVGDHLSTLLHSDLHSEVISSAKVLCETVKSLITKVANHSYGTNYESSSISDKCLVLNNKLDLLLATLNKETMTCSNIAQEESSVIDEKQFIEKEALMSRANSLKKAVRQIIEHTEKTLDDQNAKPSHIVSPEIRLHPSDNEQPFQTQTSVEGSVSEESRSHSPSPTIYVSPFLTTITTNFPLPPASSLLGVGLPGSGTLSQPYAQGRSSSNTLNIPSVTPPASPNNSQSIECQAISPLPEIRRESEGDVFLFPDDIPVPSAFADLESHPDNLSHEDIEVRIQSSTDNLVTVDEEEPFIIEEKSISDIIGSSIVDSLDTSLDAEELDAEGEEEKVRMPPDGHGKDEEEEEKTEKDSGDSEGTDDTVREKNSIKTLTCNQPLNGRITEVEYIDDTSSPDEEVEEFAEKVVEFVEKVEQFTDRAEVLAEGLTIDANKTDQLHNEQWLDVDMMPSERIVEGAENEEETKIQDPTRRISTCSTLKPHIISSLGMAAASSQAVSGKDKGHSPERSGRATTGSICKGSRRHLPIINPLVSLPMWPNIAAGVGSGGLISKALLANADALCAAASPLMDIDDSCLDGYSERCVMNNYFGIGIDAKITLDFHNKREEHPEKCRSRTKNFMWYGVLASKEWLCKTYKNLDQRVQLECDGERIPLPSLQGIVVLNIPSFMGGTNFWGGTKEDDCFLAPSFDDKILEVVAVFGSAQMAASRIINLQHHRIAQCSTVKITILGEEGVPVQVDGEAWSQPPGILRIVHKNRVQMLCRNRDLEVSLRAWEEKHKCDSQTKQPSLLADEELPCLAALAKVISELMGQLNCITSDASYKESKIVNLITETKLSLDKLWRDGTIIEGPNLRMLATELVMCVKALHQEILNIIKEETTVLPATSLDKLKGTLGNLEMELKRAHEKDHLIHFSEEEAVPPQHERKRSHSKVGLFKILKREKTKGGSLEKEVREWGPDEVATWLDSLNLTEYKESFIINDIRGSELLYLERRDLKDLGITKIGHIKRIQQGIKDIKENKAVPTT